MTPLNTNNRALRPIEKLKPNPRNARHHPDDQIAEIARSIERIGFTHSILIDETGMILAGHGNGSLPKR